MMDGLKCEFSDSFVTREPPPRVTNPSEETRALHELQNVMEQEGHALYNVRKKYVLLSCCFMLVHQDSGSESLKH